MIVALWLIRAIAGQIVGIVVYRSASDEVIADWTQVAMPGLVALAKLFLLALVVVPLVFVAVHVHRRRSESPSRHLGALAPARVPRVRNLLSRPAAHRPCLRTLRRPCCPSGAEMSGRGRPSPHPGAEEPPAGAAGGRSSSSGNRESA